MPAQAGWLTPLFDGDGRFRMVEAFVRLRCPGMKVEV
jgi:hypothetical protein